MTTRLTIVMPCHNRREALHLTLESLCRQTTPFSDFEVLVVDQASTDGSRELVRSFSPPYRLRLIEQDSKYGPSVARNEGINEAKNSLILLLDSDIIACPELVEEHIKVHEKETKILACGQVKPYPLAYRSFIEKVANPDAGLDRGETKTNLPFFQAFVGNLSLHKDSFVNIGPFDPNLSAYEDIEFSYRADRLGYKIKNCFGAIGYHNHPRTLSERFSRARKYNEMLPVLINRYPELKGQIPIFKYLEPLDFQRDDPGQMLVKLRIRAIALGIVRQPSLALLYFLDRQRLLPDLVRRIYWQLLIGSWYIGFRDGTKLLKSKLKSSTNVSEQDY